MISSLLDGLLTKLKPREFVLKVGESLPARLGQGRKGLLLRVARDDLLLRLAEGFAPPALLIRGTALVAGEAFPPAAPLRAEGPVFSGGLPDVCPEGTSAYELLVR